MAAKGKTETVSVAILLLSGVIFLVWNPTPVIAYDSTVENMRDRTNLAAEEATVKAAETMQDVKETSETWTDWARDKITEGLGLRHENAKVAAEQMKEKAGNIAMKAADTMSAAASGAADYTSQKAGQAKEAMMDKAGGATEAMMDKAGDARDNLMSNADVAKDRMADGVDEAKDGAGRAYEGAKQKVFETYEAAKDTATQSAKANYEAAKEKASTAAGDMGAKMQQMSGEL